MLAHERTCGHRHESALRCKYGKLFQRLAVRTVTVNGNENGRRSHSFYTRQTFHSHRCGHSAVNRHGYDYYGIFRKCNFRF